MKKLILVLAVFITACSTIVPQDAPSIVTDIPASPVDLPPVSSLPAGPVSLVTIGDSLTQGDGDDSGRGYPGRLLDMVNALRPGSTLTNLGQSGWSSDALINGDQGIESQLTRAVDELKSATAQGRGAVAFVWIGSNDLWYLYEYGGDANDEGDASDASRYAANMDMIIGQLRATGAQVIVALLDDQSQRPVALKGDVFTSVTRDELNRMSAQVTRYNQIIVEKAAQYGALTVDFHATDIFTNPATLYDDGNHPNQAGYDLIAQKWFEVLSTILK
jgi:lysophospholipase L1-like esterase